MDCFRFEIIVPDLEKAFQELQTHRGVEVFGNVERGSFLIHVPFVGMVAGDFFSTGNRITIKITDRPASVSCVGIEKYLNHFVQQLQTN
jgi:hypothetical protein